MEKRENRERFMGKGETRVSDSEGVRREKSKGKRKKVRNLTMREGRSQKKCFPQLQTKIIFIGDATSVREIVFQKFFLENNI